MTIKPLKLLIFVTLIASLVAYTFYFNPQPLTVKYANSDDKVITAPTAVILMIVFLSGFLLSSIFATYIGLQNSLKYWRKDANYKNKDLHLSNIITAREQISLGDYESARNILEKIIDNDPNDIIAGFMLVRSFRNENDFKSALKTMEDLRAANPKNLEILMQIAEIYEEQLNLSAAYDNYKLLFENSPKNKLIISRLIQVCLKLKKVEEALELAKKLVKLADNYEEQQALLNQEAEIELKVLLQNNDNKPTLELKKGIEQLLKKHKDFSLGYFHLALIEKNKFQLDQAGKLFSLAFSIDPKLTYLEEMTKMWLGAELPDKAISFLRTNINKHSRDDSQISSPIIDSKIFLAELLCYLEDLSGSKKELEELNQLSATSSPQKQKIKLLLSIIDRKNGSAEEAFSKISELAKNFIQLNSFSYMQHSNSSNRNFDEFGEWSKKAKETLRINQSPTA